MKKEKIAKKLEKDKLNEGLISLLIIIILLFSILAGTIYYGNNITANAVQENSNFDNSMQIQTVDNIQDLNQLNEGWYQIRNGFVYYLETFDSYIPLYIKVKNLEQQNKFFVVDEYGAIRFDESFDGLIVK